MHILFISPNANLNTRDELPHLTSGYQVTALIGMVDRSKLEVYLSNTQYAVLHFAQHGDRGILELSDGALDMADLVSMLHAQQQLQCIFLNACNSIAVAVKLHNAFHIPIIAHDAPITDAAAVRFTETLYRGLRATQGNIQESFQRALDTLHRLYPDDARTPQLINGDMADKRSLQELRVEISEGFAHFNQRLDVLEATMNTLSNTRFARLQLMIVIFLGVLIVAQIATPLLNALLLR